MTLHTPVEVETLHEGVRTTLERVRRVRDGVLVVRKRLRAPSPTARELQRLRREYDFARAAAGDGVPAMYGLSTEAGAAWIEMEMCPGESLGALRARGPVGVATSLRIARGLLTVLARVHRAGVTHSDVNPSNVLVDRASSRLFLLDFGTARAAQPYLPQRSDRIEGTPGYMAPEQTGRMNRAIDARSDYYGLGATLYHLLTGVPPFAGADPAEIVYAQMARRAVRPRDREPAVPEVVSDLVMTLLAKDADQRYQTEAGLAADLDACLASLDASGRIAAFPLRRADRSALRVPDRLYGRDADLARLEAALASVTGGGREAIFVAGPAGSGKTALVTEALRGAGTRRALLVSGKFEQFRRDVPYASVVTALRELVRQLLGLDEARLAAWKGRLKDALGDVGGALTDVLPELEELVGRLPKPPDVAAVDGEHRFRSLLTRLIAALPSPGAPVVLCFDDLQWADLASVALVEQLLADPSLGGVLLLGTFRSDEVDETHPLRRAIARARELGATPDERHLGPLEIADVTQLLADALGKTAEDVAALAALAHAWAAGNPFLVSRVVQGLGDDGLLRFENGAWAWSLPEIRQRGLGDDAARYVAGRIDDLPEDARTTLEAASCLGTRFSLHLLAAVLGEAPSRVHAHLAPALASKLVFAVNEDWWPGASDDVDADLAFAHDRIQEALHARLSPEAKERIHARAGRALLVRPAADIFDVVHHLNLGAPLLTAEERADLRRRDADAGRRALRSGAFGSALALLERAIALSPEDAWARAPDEQRALFLDTARAASLSGAAARMNAVLDEVIAHASSPTHRVAALEVRALDLAGRDMFGAIDVALTGLADLGLVLPRNPTMAEVGAAMGGAMAVLGERGPSGVLSLPDLAEPKTAAAVSLANAIMAPAYVAVPLLLPVLAAEIVRMTALAGVTPEATYGYAILALVLTGTGALGPGHDLAQLCLRLLERFHDRGHDARPGHVLMGMVLPHTMPLRAAVERHRAYLPRALASGDHEYAMWIAHLSLANGLYAGLPLDELDVDLTRESRAMLRLGQRVPWMCTDPQRRLVRALRGEAARPDRLGEDGRTEEEELASLVSAGARGAAYVLSTHRAFQRFLFRDFTGALAAADAGEPYVDGVMSTYHPIVMAEVVALSCLAIAESAGAEERARLLLRMAKNRATLDPHDAYAPHNHRFRTRLIDAELARLEGRPLAAMDAYDEAIQAARDGGFVHEEAIANELAGRFFLARGKGTVARAYILEAYGAYARWGATAKLRRLEEELPDLTRATLASGKGPITIDLAGEDLDLGAVWDAALAITSEIRTERLADRILSVSMGNAGATRGLLLLERDGKLWLEAAAGEGAPASGAELSDVPDVPISILEHVARTGEELVLADVRCDARFASDPAVRSDRPLSVVALPLATGGRSSGLLYLENDLVAGAFSLARRKLLGMLGAQAAIAIANARLYRALEGYSKKLEEEVKDRTRAAEEAQREAELAQQAAEAASSAKSAFLASMSHELRTPMNAILGFTKIVLRRSGDALPVQQRENLEKVVTSGNHLLALINDVLDLSKIEAGRMDLRLSDLPLTPLARECVSLTGSLAEARAQRLSLDSAGDVTAHADGDKVREILLNLIGNAVKFTKEGGSVMVRCYVDDAGACLAVEDSGVGIAKESLEDVFVEFWQHGGGTSRQSGGTGLGLAISRKLARAMGGDVTVDSEVGRGSTFTLRLPRARAARLHEGSSQGAPAGGRAS
jgi:predicted ATPase/signal transduction histidine kinase